MSEEELPDLEPAVEVSEESRQTGKSFAYDVLVETQRLNIIKNLSSKESLPDVITEEDDYFGNRPYIHTLIARKKADGTPLCKVINLKQQVLERVPEEMICPHKPNCLTWQCSECISDQIVLEPESRPKSV